MNKFTLDGSNFGVDADGDVETSLSHPLECPLPPPDGLVYCAPAITNKSESIHLTIVVK